MGLEQRRLVLKRSELPLVQRPVKSARGTYTKYGWRLELVLDTPRLPKMKANHTVGELAVVKASSW